MPNLLEFQDLNTEDQSEIIKKPQYIFLNKSNTFTEY